MELKTLKFLGLSQKLRSTRKKANKCKLEQLKLLWSRGPALLLAGMWEDGLYFESQIKSLPRS